MGRIRSAKRFTVQGRFAGSALILTVVLTSLLAIVAVLFLMTSRIDKMSSSATMENQELNYAVDSIIARIGEELAQDVPDPNRRVEYYDFPDASDPWLADLEPNAVQVSTDSNGEPVYQCHWRQISDVTGYLKRRGFRTQDVDVDPCGPSKVIVEYPDIVEVSLPDGIRELGENWADADGDGIADSKWIEFDELKVSRGRPVYAAIRIIDHGAMLNANTGYLFDPDANDAWVDGHSQLQVNVLGLAVRAGLRPTFSDEAKLFSVWASGARSLSAGDLQQYEQQVIWQYGDPDPQNRWTPFDLSDELELRDRYCINGKTWTRMEALWNTVGSDRSVYLISQPYDSYRNQSDPKGRWRRLDDWIERVTYHPAAVEPDRRHLVTTYNMDRILTPGVLQIPDGRQLRKMVNVNRLGEDIPLDIVRDIIADALGEVYRGLDQNDVATQITANLKDYIDEDDEVTVLAGRQTSDWYGFERPCVYISEVACRLKRDANTGAEYKSYAIELHRPYFEDGDPQQGEWYLVVVKSTGEEIEQGIAWSGTRRFNVLLNEDPGAPLKADYLRFSDPDPPDPTYDPRIYRKSEQLWNGLAFEEGDRIKLVRKIPSRPTGLEVDYVQVPAGLVQKDDVARSVQRDVSPDRCFWRLWGAGTAVSLGNAANNYVSPTAPPVLQAHPANRPMRNIGELGMVFAQYGYYREDTTLPPSKLLIDLADPNYSRLFNYLTVIDPLDYGHPPDETRVMGRININTAPWFVLAQLPWMKYPYEENDPRSLDRARAIVAGRNPIDPSDPARSKRLIRPYRSIGDLMQITSQEVDPNATTNYRVFALLPDGEDNQHSNVRKRGPDVTPDTALDDLEERDLIFTRISNLITVRSDVFTAYILVRIGTDGPQRRVIAILDRSRVNGPGDKVRVVAEHLVPDPR